MSRPIPIESRVLCLMHNLGSTSKDKALTIKEIARIIELDPPAIQPILDSLVKAQYVSKEGVGNTLKYYVTGKGVLVVSAMYS